MQTINANDLPDNSVYSVWTTDATTGEQNMVADDLSITTARMITHGLNRSHIELDRYREFNSVGRIVRVRTALEKSIDAQETVIAEAVKTLITIFADVPDMLRDRIRQAISELPQVHAWNHLSELDREITRSYTPSADITRVV